MKWLYKISNTVNDKLYIGVTIDPARRWRQHQLSNTQCSILKNAMRKYGVENFKFELLLCGDEEYIDYQEVMFIKEYNTQTPNGYNITIGGDGTSYVYWDDDWNCLLGTDTDRAIAEKLGIGKGVVKSRRDSLGIISYAEKNTVDWEKWLPILGTDTDKIIGDRVGVTPNMIYSKRKEFNIPPYKPQSKRYEYPEELTEMLGKVPDTTLAEQYNIPYSAVSQYRVKLGIARCINQKGKGAIVWNEEQINVLESDTLKIKDIADLLGVSISSVSRYRRDNNIFRYKRK